MASTPFKQGDTVSVFCEEYQKEMEAEIIDFRHHMQQAYVHFIKQDKRLDRWIDVSQIHHLSDSAATRGEEHVMTRNQRKARLRE